MSRKLNKEEKIAFIESLDDLNREEKDRLLYELAQIDDLSEIIDYIDNLYHRTLKRIAGRLEAFERVSKNRSDSLPFYLLSLTKTDQLKTKQEIAGFVKKHPDLTEWSRSIKVKTNADALFAGVEMDIAEMTGKINKRIETHLKQTYQETYLNRAYNYHKQTKREPNFKPERLEEEYLQKAINENFKGKRFSERVWGSNMDELVSRVESLVTNDLNRGYPIDQSSKLLAIEFDRARNRAVTVLQTETNGIQAQATLDEYQDDNIKKYRYLATLEVHTCPICGELDGKVFLVKDAEKGVNYPTMHPHCRCTTVPALEKGGKRYARDIETGKGYEVESGQTFKDWRKQQLDKYGQTAIKDKLQAERLEKDRVRRTKEQFIAYRQVLGSQNMPKTFAGFYDLKYNDVNKFGMIQLDFKRQSRLQKNPQLTLPNVDNIIISEKKFTHYLFNPDRPKGFAKGKNITHLLGYDLNNYREMIEEISNRAPKYPTKAKTKDEHGHRYEQKMVMYGIKNNPVNVIVAWNVTEEGTHLTSAYIKEVSDEDRRI